MIIGFGDTEIKTAIAAIKECEKAIKESIENAENTIKAIQTKYSVFSETARYSYFFFNCIKIYEGRYIVEYTFHHINRKHAFSPDGWGLLITHWVLSISPNNETRIYKEYSI